MIISIIFLYKNDIRMYDVILYSDPLIFLVRKKREGALTYCSDICVNVKLHSCVFHLEL